MFKLVEDSDPVAEADPTAFAPDDAEATIPDGHSPAITTVSEWSLVNQERAIHRRKNCMVHLAA
jgi:hypothetical protein